MKRIAVFGGAFDPIHFAHLILAQDILFSSSSEIVFFMPSFQPPHKMCFAPFNERLRMVKLAIDGNPRFKCSDIEEKLPKPSYTIQTLRALKEELGDASISFIMGMDSAIEFATWREPEALLNEFRMLVLPRPGFSQQEIEEGFRERMVFLSERKIDISSTEIRTRIKEGREIRYLTPNNVISYIAREGLYAR